MTEQEEKIVVKKELITEATKEAEALSLGIELPSIENVCPVCGHANCLTKRICEVCSNLLY